MGSSKEAFQLVNRVRRGHYPNLVMFLWGVSYVEVTDPYLKKKIKKINYPEHSRVGRHSVPHFLPNSGGIAY